MSVEEFKTLFGYDWWATEKLLETVSSLDETRYRRDLGSSHGGIHGTLVHIYAADRIWLDRWQGKQTAALVQESEMQTLEQLREQWADLRAELDELLQSLTDERLRTPLRFMDTQGNPHVQPLYQLMQHRINHSTYHRGQVVTMLRQLGLKPPQTDLVLYYRLQAG